MKSTPARPSARVNLESLDLFRDNLQSLVAEKAKTLPNFRYCDLRIEIREEKGAVAEAAPEGEPDKAGS